MLVSIFLAADPLKKKNITTFRSFNYKIGGAEAPPGFVHNSQALYRKISDHF